MDVNVLDRRIPSCGVPAMDLHVVRFSFYPFANHSMDCPYSAGSVSVSVSTAFAIPSNVAL